MIVLPTLDPLLRFVLFLMFVECKAASLQQPCLTMYCSKMFSDESYKDVTICTAKQFSLKLKWFYGILEQADKNENWLLHKNIVFWKEFKINLKITDWGLLSQGNKNLLLTGEQRQWRTNCGGLWRWTETEMKMIQSLVRLGSCFTQTVVPDKLFNIQLKLSDSNKLFSQCL